MRYNDWESIQRHEGLTPARNVEKALKWGEKSGASGKRNATVTAYMADHSSPKAGF